MSGSQYSRKTKNTKYTKRLQTELQSVVAYACYDSDKILTSGKTMKKAHICDLLYDMYMPPPGKKKSDRMSYVDMFLEGVGKFEGLWNMEEGKKNGEMLILSPIMHTLDDEMFVGENCISRSLMTRKKLTNNVDIKKERLLIHAKDVEANCTKALRLCLTKDSPYKDYYSNNATFPSGENWFDYSKWIRKEIHKIITKHGGTNFSKFQI